MLSNQNVCPVPDQWPCCERILKVKITCISNRILLCLSPLFADPKITQWMLHSTWDILSAARWLSYTSVQGETLLYIRASINSMYWLPFLGYWFIVILHESINNECKWIYTQCTTYYPQSNFVYLIFSISILLCHPSNSCFICEGANAHNKGFGQVQGHQECF